MRPQLIDDDRGGISGEEAVRRLFAGDHTLWSPDPTEISDRLGWIPVVGEVAQAFHVVRERCDTLRQDIDHILLMGMGGSSLFPEVLARTFPPEHGYPRLHVLDTTHPAAIARVARQCPPERTLHVASSKSGSTIETRSHLEWAWQRADGAGRFTVITDPRLELGALAASRKFAQIFENRPEIGGRYSALSLFGIVPAMLAGFDAEGLVRGGLQGLKECGPDEPPGTNPALTLARSMANGVAIGHDKLTFRLADEVATFGLWLEQLVAESLGKDGLGLVPVVGERPGPPKVYGDDRTYVDLGVLPTAPSIGRNVVIAEVATALAGAFIGVHPFDQPDVAAAKKATNMILTNRDSTVPMHRLEELLREVQPGYHVAIQAFVDPEGPHAAPLEDARMALRDELRVAVTLGFGPRYLHSTGQLHKGGPREIVCIQVLDDEGAAEIHIPKRDIGFGELMRAQAAGDLKVLADRGRTAGRVELSELLAVAPVKLGMVGLGKMGGNMVERLRAKGHEVVGYDAFSPASEVGSLADLVAALETPRVVWVMVPSGEPTETTVSELTDLLGTGDVIIDGGNSNWEDSVRRSTAVAAAGLGFIDAGTSGGVWGHDNGYCLMVGGSDADVATAQPIFDALAPEDGFAHVGRPGTGHFTKMVHNGVEYGLMQAYAEGYELLARSGLEIDATKALGAWRQGSVVRSWLLDLFVRALEQHPGLDGIAPVAKDSGEGRWTVDAAVARGVPIPAITAALFARFSSQDSDSVAMKAIAALRDQFGGHGVVPEDAPGEGPAVTATRDAGSV